MKNGDVLTVYEALMELSKHPETKLSVRAGYILAKDRKILEEEARIIYEERKKILMEYGEYQKDGSVVVPKDKISEANVKINELMEIECDVKVLMVPMEDLEEAELEIGITEGLMEIIQLPVVTGLPIIED